MQLKSTKVTKVTTRQANIAWTRATTSGYNMPTAKPLSKWANLAYDNQQVDSFANTAKHQQKMTYNLASPANITNYSTATSPLQGQSGRDKDTIYPITSHQGFPYM